MPLVILILDILLVEILRPFVYKLIVLACNRLNEVEIPLSITVPSELYKLSLCVGMGIGFINVLTMYVSSFQWNVVLLFLSLLLELMQTTTSPHVSPFQFIFSLPSKRDYSKHSIITPILICIWHIIEGVVVGVCLLS